MTKATASRMLIALLAAPMALGVTACNPWNFEPLADREPLPGPSAWNRPVTPPSDAQAAQLRADCHFGPGALPAETQGVSHPNGDAIPIDHVFVVMMENRSFDHYFQDLPAHGIEADVAPADFANPDADGEPVPIFHQPNHCFADTNHSWAGIHAQIAGGAMTGFVTTNEGFHERPAPGHLEIFGGARAMGYYDASDLPFYYALAQQFAIGDRYFSSLPGPTFPNRMYMYAASSFGAVHNTVPPSDVQLIVDYLDQREISWKVYTGATPGLALFLVQSLSYGDHIASIDELFSDAAAGTLPGFAFIDPEIGLGTGTHDSNDEHPPALPQLGQRFVAEVVDALGRSPAWSRTALFLTYDEHGGTFDHVPPPSACPPDDIPAQLEPGDPPGAFDQLGPRVPFVLVSPYAKQGYVSHVVYDHTSILRFVEARYVMPALSARDANAMAPWDMFDFTQPPRPAPAIPLPEVPVDEVASCGALFR